MAPDDAPSSDEEEAAPMNGDLRRPLGRVPVPGPPRSWRFRTRFCLTFRSLAISRLIALDGGRKDENQTNLAGRWEDPAENGGVDAEKWSGRRFFLEKRRSSEFSVYLPRGSTADPLELGYV